MKITNYPEESRIRRKVVFLRKCTNPNAKYQEYEGRYYQTMIETNTEYSLLIGDGYYIYVWKSDCDTVDPNKINGIEIYNGGPVKENEQNWESDFRIHKNILSNEEYIGYLKGRILDQPVEEEFEKLKNALEKENKINHLKKQSKNETKR